VQDRVVDAHMHLWDLEKIPYPWLTPPLPVGIPGDVSAIAKSYLLDDNLNDARAAGSTLRVSKVVHVEAGASPAASLAETPVDRDAAGVAAWRTGMRELAQPPNVAISGLAMLDWHWSVESLRPFVLEAIEIFGTERCLFASGCWPRTQSVSTGSDWPSGRHRLGRADMMRTHEHNSFARQDRTGHGGRTRYRPR
jgi:predicted TIM-barrel fold metal-dependent hydrolase